MGDLKYPAGEFQMGAEDLTSEQRQQFIREIAMTPLHLRAAVKGLSEEQLDTPYRPEGWTVRQVVHHLADSHMNAYIRFKLALTEDNPTIKPYNEALCAALDDSRRGAVDPSLDLITSLHERWVTLLEKISPNEWTRSFLHPERGSVSLNANLALYSWHCRHHVAHITSLRERMGWK